MDALSGAAFAFFTALLLRDAIGVMDDFLTLDAVELDAFDEDDVAALLLDFFLSSLLSSIETTVFLRDFSAPALPDTPDPLSFLFPVVVLLEAFDLAGALRFEADAVDDCFFSAFALDGKENIRKQRLM